MSHFRKSSGMHLDYDGGFSNQDDFSLMEDLPMVLLANPSVLLHALSLAESLWHCNCSVDVAIYNILFSVLGICIRSQQIQVALDPISGLLCHCGHIMLLNRDMECLDIVFAFDSIVWCSMRPSDERQWKIISEIPKRKQIRLDCHSCSASHISCLTENHWSFLGIFKARDTGNGKEWNVGKKELSAWQAARDTRRSPERNAVSHRRSIPGRMGIVLMLNVVSGTGRHVKAISWDQARESPICR